jgi:hypothetical protein
VARGACGRGRVYDDGMTTDLSALESERADLDRRIAGLRLREAESSAGQAQALRAGLDAALRESGLPFYERDGAVTVVVSPDERVTIAFGGTPDRSGVEVRYGSGGRAGFTGPLPGPGALAGLVRGLVGDALARDAEPAGAVP